MLTSSASLRPDLFGDIEDIPRTSQFRSPALNKSTVDIAPREVATRRSEFGEGLAAEIVQTIRPERFDIRFHAPVHLLVVVEEGVRVAGESSVEGLPPSTLRDMRRKLTFVPAGHNYHEWHQTAVPTRVIYFYFDPAKSRDADALHAPRLFFEDTALWETALKLGRLLDAPATNGLCLQALGVILAHELVRPEATLYCTGPRARGGLAGWQKRIVVDFIEENLAENISLATLAQLVQLSPYHFCRAFKQSFGVPPHRYHTRRRIDRAKVLLANPGESVTSIGMAIGFSETSSFTAAFRKTSGMTPTDYRRGLG
jgi:AraC family transcriptional regulator